MGVDFQRNVHGLLGLPFDGVSMQGAIQHVREAVTQRRRCFISTPNLNFVTGCRSDSSFRDSVVNSDLSIADGMPLVWIARMLGVPIRERVAGSDLFDRLKADQSNRLSVFFFGGMEGVAEKACQRINQQQSGLVCAGFEFPGFGTVEQMSSADTIARINASGADFLLVSLGAKKGQSWIERNRARITVPVLSHLGAVVNFAAGKTNRAPAWMQGSGLEWLSRIREEPMLWRRYAVDGLMLLHLLLSRVLPLACLQYMYRPSNDALRSAGVSVHHDGGESVIRLRGAWVRSNLGPLRECFASLALGARDLRIDLERVCYLDSSCLGLLLLLHGAQKRHGKSLWIGPATGRAARLIKYGCAEFLLDSGNTPVTK